LNDGLYSVSLGLMSYATGVTVHFQDPSAIMFNVHDPIDGIVTRAGSSAAIPGAVRPLLQWKVAPNIRGNS
jgi:lipopolysaccharide transport system ATP-binding protein